MTIESENPDRIPEIVVSSLNALTYSIGVATATVLRNQDHIHTYLSLAMLILCIFNKLDRAPDEEEVVLNVKKIMQKFKGQMLYEAAEPVEILSDEELDVLCSFITPHWEYIRSLPPFGQLFGGADEDDRFNSAFLDQVEAILNEPFTPEEMSDEQAGNEDA